MLWKDIYQILYPDEELTKLPPIIIPLCRWRLYSRVCQVEWSKEVILPWMREKFKGTYLNNMTDYDSYPLDTYIPDFPGASMQSYGEMFVYSYVFPFLLFMGTVASFPIIVILFKFSHYVWSTCFFLSVSQIVDLIILYVYCGNDWYFQIFEEDLSTEIMTWSNSICKLYSFLMSFLIYLSPWMAVTVAIDMTISLAYPHRIYKMCTRERANATLLLITVLVTFINLHYFWTQGLTEETSEFADVRYCHDSNVDELAKKFTQDILPMMDFIIQQVIPIHIIIICLIVIIARHRKSAQREAELQLSKYFLDVKALSEMRRIAVIMCVWYSTVLIYMGIMNMLKKNMPNLDHRIASKLDLVEKILRYTYLSLKPLLFYTMVSKVRSEIVSAFLCIFRPLRRPRHYRITQTHNPVQELDETNEAQTELLQKSTDV